jgi:hypothetical protein
MRQETTHLLLAKLCIYMSVVKAPVPQVLQMAISNLVDLMEVAMDTTVILQSSVARAAAVPRIFEFRETH